MRRAQADKADKGAKTPAGNKAGYQRLSKHPLYFGSYDYDLPSFIQASDEDTGVLMEESEMKNVFSLGRCCFVLQFSPNAYDNWRHVDYNFLGLMNAQLACMPACLPTYVHLRTHGLTCLCTSARQYVQTEWKTHTYMHAYIHTYLHTYMHTYMHT